MSFIDFSKSCKIISVRGTGSFPKADSNTHFIEWHLLCSLPLNFFHDPRFLQDHLHRLLIELDLMERIQSSQSLADLVQNRLFRQLSILFDLYFVLWITRGKSAALILIQAAFRSHLLQADWIPFSSWLLPVEHHLGSVRALVDD